MCQNECQQDVSTLNTQFKNQEIQLSLEKKKITELQQQLDDLHKVAASYERQNKFQRDLLKEMQEKMNFYKKRQNPKLAKTEQFKFEKEISKKRYEFQQFEKRQIEISGKRPFEGSYISTKILQESEWKRKQEIREQNPQQKKLKRAILSKKRYNTEAFWKVLEDEDDNPQSKYFWDLTTDQYSPYGADMVFIQDSEIYFHNYDKQQMNSDLRGVQYLSDKTLFSQTLVDYDKKLQSNKNTKISIQSNDFYPKTFILSPNSILLTPSEREFLNFKSDSFWIQKDETGSGGKGIDMIEDFSKFQKQYEQHKKDQILEQSQEKFEDFVVQEYIYDALKLKNQKKCDQRIMLLTIYTGKNWVIFMQKMPYWFVRCALEDFSTEKASLNIHTTHQQKLYEMKDKLDGETYDKIVEDLQYSGQVIEEAIKQNSEQDLQEISIKYQQILAYSFLAGLDKVVNHNIGTFRVWGVDSMLDSNLKPWIFEINSAPDLKLASPLRNQLSTQFAKDVVKIVMAFQENWNQMDEFASKYKEILNNEGSSLIEIFNGASGYNVIDM